MPMSGSILQLAARQVELSSGVRTDVIPYVSDVYNLGSPSKLWKTGYLSELYSLLFSQNTIVLLGSKFVVGKGQGAIVSFVSASATQVDFGIPMTPNDFVLFRVPLQMEAMQVGSLASGSTVYNVTRNLDGSGANDWNAGDVFLVLGYDGDGRIELNADTTPQMNIYRQGVTWNGGSELIRIGDLNGNWGYTTETYGAAFGEYTTNKPNITIDSSSGLRMRNYATDVIRLDTSGCNLIAGKLAISGSTGAIAVGDVPPSGSSVGTGIWIDRNGLYNVKSDTTNIYLGGSGIEFYGRQALRMRPSTLVDYPYSFIGPRATDLTLYYQDGISSGCAAMQVEEDNISFFGENPSHSFNFNFKSGGVDAPPIGAIATIGFSGSTEYLYAPTISTTRFVFTSSSSILYGGSLISYKNSERYVGYIFVPSGSPLTSGSFDGDSFSTVGKTLIDLSTVFGAPTEIKAVQLNVSVQDSGASGTDCYVIFSKNNISGCGIAVGCMPANDRYNRQQITVPCDANGDIYYQVQASGGSTLDMYLQINGYYI